MRLVAAAEAEAQTGQLVSDSQSVQKGFQERRRRQWMQTQAKKTRRSQSRS